MCIRDSRRIDLTAFTVEGIDISDAVRRPCRQGAGGDLSIDIQVESTRLADFMGIFSPVDVYKRQEAISLPFSFDRNSPDGLAGLEEEEEPELPPALPDPV